MSKASRLKRKADQKKADQKARKKAQDRQTSTLSQHKQKGKTLTPPLLNMANQASMVFSSWSDDRLPEMLWAVILISNLERDSVLDIFRRVAPIIAEEFKSNTPSDHLVFPDASISHLATIDHNAFNNILDAILETPGSKGLLQTLCKFDNMPGIERWRDKLGENQAPDNWDNIIGKAILNCFDHQSEAATDCRWMRMLVVILSGKMVFQNGSDLPREILDYPNRGELRRVRPSIRAVEISIPFSQSSNTWSNNFWDYCYKNTPCAVIDNENKNNKPDFRVHLSDAFEAIRTHWKSTSLGTKTDFKHDAVFGLTLYAASICAELAMLPTSHTILGRSAIRTLAELFITMNYLVKKDATVLYKQYRSYGCGQAKLLLLKIREGAHSPNFIDPELLEQLCNEDYWEEFQNIELGNWANTDLRKMSIESDTKDTYDTYYSITSSYTHGHWCAVRNSCYTICVNPLHRFHRIPKQNFEFESDTTLDAISLFDNILSVLDKAYPSFEFRVVTTD